MNINRSKILILFLAVGLFTAFLIFSYPSLEIVEYHGPTMGTTYEVKVVKSKQIFEDPRVEGSQNLKIQTAIQSALEDVNQKMSTYLSDSELSKFNQFHSGEWFPVSEETARVVKRGLEVSEMTGGAFDMTVGPLVNLWGFGPESRPVRSPTQEELKSRLSQIGYKNIRVRLDPPALYKEKEGVEIDLSAIAKGFAVDQVYEVLRKLSLNDFMIEVGGEVRVSGRNQEEKPWRIGIEKPSDGKREVLKVLEFETEAMATSGSYRNFFMENGKRFSHTIDPRTGKPIEHFLVAVSVISKNTMDSDAFATAFMVLGSEAGVQVADQYKIAALFLVQKEGSVVEVPSKAFRDRYE